MTRKSILLVTVDCLRADHVGFMGYGRPTTPFLDSLAAESFVFPAAIVAGAPTYYSLPSILASRYPLALGRDVLGLSADEPTLASVLKQAGYATAAFVAANPYISARFGYEQGFDVFHDFLGDDRGQEKPARAKSARGESGGGEASAALNNIENGAAGESLISRLNRKVQSFRSALGPAGLIYDELYFQYCQRSTPVAGSLDALRRFPAADIIIDEASRWLKTIADQPFFLWLHLMDPHSPYYPKQEASALMGEAPLSPFRGRYLNSFWNRSDIGTTRLARHRDAIIALYDAGIRWVDKQAAGLIGRLRESGQWDQCIFAFTADHGEEFLDHDGRYHSPSRLMEELIRVPLLLRVPDLAKKDSPRKELTKTPFSLLHLAPTLLDVADVAVPAAFAGKSCWPQVCDGGAYDAVAISECVAGCINPFHSDNRLGPRVLSVRESRYKLVLHFDPSAENLYDLEADPGEHAPLAPSAQKPVRRRLLEIAREHLRQSLERRDAKMRVRARLHELQLKWNDSANESSANRASRMAS
jgi:arylsulfatase A-like enzyme